MSKIIPNSFPHPNFYIDELDAYLTAEESKVLTHAIREILGWDDKIESRQARIAYSVLLHGRTNKNGEKVYHGVNLGTNALKSALDALHKYKILVRIGSARHPKGQLYQLTDDESKIDWEGLEQRKSQKQEHGRQRMKSAQTAKNSIVTLSMDKRVVNSFGSQKSKNETLSAHKRVTLSMDKRVTLLSDKRKENQIENHNKKTTTTTDQISIRDHQNSCQDSVAVVVENSHQKKSYLDIKTLPAEVPVNGGKLDPATFADRLSEIALHYNVNAVALEQFVCHQEIANNENGLQELEIVLQYSQSHKRQNASLLGFAKNLVFHGKATVNREQTQQTQTSWSPEARARLQEVLSNGGIHS